MNKPGDRITLPPDGLVLEAIACPGRCQWGRLCETCGTSGEKRDGTWHPGILWREVKDDIPVS